MTREELEKKLIARLEDYGEKYWNSVVFACDPGTEDTAKELIDMIAEWAIRSLLKEAREMREALAPFAKFAEAFQAHPIASLDDSLYSIHGGEACEFGADLKLSDCDRARRALAGEVSR